MYYLDWLEIYINESAINNQIRQIQYLVSTISKSDRIAWLLKAINFIDLTSLNGNDTSSTIERLCEKVC
jgi:deoxyribose-phosphate aldolase